MACKTSDNCCIKEVKLSAIQGKVVNSNVLAMLQYSIKLIRSRKQTRKQLKMTDKHTAEHSNTACLGIDWHVCDVYIAHITIWPNLSISLTEVPFCFYR